MNRAKYEEQLSQTCSCFKEKSSSIFVGSGIANSIMGLIFISSHSKSEPASSPAVLVIQLVRLTQKLAHDKL